jgi:hypothetical protein
MYLLTVREKQNKIEVRGLSGNFDNTVMIVLNEILNFSQSYVEKYILAVAMLLSAIYETKAAFKVSGYPKIAKKD